MGVRRMGEDAVVRKAVIAHDSGDGTRRARASLLISAMLLCAQVWGVPGLAMQLQSFSPVAGADAGTQAAQPLTWFDLAQRYEHGEGLEQDYRAALELYCRAADAGVAAAAHNLGWMYLNGRGVDHDDDAAATWFAVAAEMGHDFSRKLLARLPSARRDASLDCPSREPAGPGQLAAGTEKLDLLAPESIKELSRKSAARFDLDPYLILAVIAVESGFEPGAVSHKQAQGLMQLIPETAARFAVADAFDPEDNIRGGAEYLRWLIDHFDGDLKLALAGYNAGEGAVRAYSGVPPYPETISYLEKVRVLYDHPALQGTLAAEAGGTTEALKIAFSKAGYVRSR